MHMTELEWIRELQDALRSPWLDQFFRGWNYVDSVLFSTIVIVIVWYLISRRVGVRLVYILIISGLANQILKSYFGLPRPCQIHPAVGLVCPSSLGFPSGAAQTAVLYAGILFIECRQRLYQWLGVLFGLILCFSRIYLGVHYFTDILGGLVVGGVLLMIYWKLFPLAAKNWKVWAILFPIFLLIIGGRGGLYNFGVTTGIAVGLILANDKMESWRTRWLQTAVVLIGVFICFKAKATYPTLSLFFGLLSGFWLSYLGAHLVSWRKYSN